MNKITKLCLSLRYLYYVENISLVDDNLYDLLEAKALKTKSGRDKLDTVGSDIKESYPDEIISFSEQLKDELFLSNYIDSL